MKVIFGYTREQALKDGVLVDVSAMAREAGFRIPVAVTDTVWNGYIVPQDGGEKNGQSTEGRLWDTLFMAYLACRNGSNTDRVSFDVLYDMNGKAKIVNLIAMIGPGDHGEPVLTIMKPEDA